MKNIFSSISGFFSGAGAFLSAVPALIALCQELKNRIDEAELDHKVADDVKKIHEAFSANDPAKLNALFRS